MNEHNDDTAELIERLRLWLFEDESTNPIDASQSTTNRSPTTVDNRDAAAAGLDRGG